MLDFRIPSVKYKYYKLQCESVKIICDSVAVALGVRSRAGAGAITPDMMTLIYTDLRSLRAVGVSSLDS